MAQTRAAVLIDALGLAPHPEGGHYREIHRAERLIDPRDGRPLRSAITAIYFLLTVSETSRWHRVRSDEIWQFVEGDPLELYEADPNFDAVNTTVIGSKSEDRTLLHVIEADWWQAARTTGSYTLVACTVAPGFDYADFAMLREHPTLCEEIRRKHPAFAELI
jgi:uncharacterized protein